MSGTKNALAELVWLVEEGLIARRERQAIEEAARRAEAEERARLARFEAIRAEAHAEVSEILARIEERRGDLAGEDATALLGRGEKLAAAIRAAVSELPVRNMASDLHQLRRDFDGALGRSRQEKEAARSGRSSALAERLDLESRLEAIPAEDAMRFDAGGCRAAGEALDALRAALEAPDSAAALATARVAVESHERRTARERALHQGRAAAAESAAGEISGLIAGLRADPVVMRWAAAGVDGLEIARQEAEHDVARERFDRPAVLLASARASAATLIEEAGAAQLKADHRDYIAASIAKSLEEMGFAVGTPRPEHPEQPASAVILDAATASGRGVSVSVPVEGEVWYDVEGFPMRTEATVDGGSAATCDEAEAILEEMHETLQQEFGVKMGELQWDGKADPDRVLRQADELPSGGAARSDRR